MTKRTRFSLFIFFMFMAMPVVYPVISFNPITSWFFNQSEETFYREYPCKKNSTITIQNINGSIVIKTWPSEKIIIQAVKKGKEKSLDQIDIEIVSLDNTITIKTVHHEKAKGPVDYFLIIPEKTALNVATNSGSIKIENVNRPIKAKAAHGAIEIHDASNDLFIKNSSGSITVRMNDITPSTRVMLEASGSIQLYLPPKASASINAKTTHGTIMSEIPLIIESRTMKLTRQTWSSWKRALNAIVGTGDAEITLISINGSIKILE